MECHFKYSIKSEQVEGASGRTDSQNGYTLILWNNKIIPSIYKCNGIRAVPIGNEEMVSMYSLHYILQEAFVDKDIFFYLSPLIKNWVKKSYIHIPK